MAEGDDPRVAEEDIKSDHHHHVNQRLSEGALEQRTAQIMDDHTEDAQSRNEAGGGKGSDEAVAVQMRSPTPRLTNRPWGRTSSTRITRL